MDYIVLGLTAVSFCLILINRLRIEQLAQERDLDMKFLEWHMRSIDNRKQDKEKEPWLDGIEVDDE